MTLQLVVSQLKQAKQQAEKELSGITEALRVLTHRKPIQSEKRVMSLSARRRISKAQRERWAAWRKNGKKAA